MKIGLLSDTHAYWDPRYQYYFKDCDEIWHAGDMGSPEIADRMAQLSVFRAVYGNCDGAPLRQRFPLYDTFVLEGVTVLMTHIGGYPGKYAPGIASLLEKTKPTLFVSGHSHILKVKYDPVHKLLHINPGAAGHQGFHTVRTLLRFELKSGRIENLEVIELADDVKPL